MDLILGDGEVRRRLELLEDVGEMENRWKADLAAYAEVCRGIRLYA